ncbi:hypothetical protein ACWDF9_35090 [Streptomyces rubiginosohelvolus]
MVQQSRRETRTPEPDFTDTTLPFTGLFERPRARTLARALLHTHNTPDRPALNHGDSTRCSACHATITWHFDDPDAHSPYGLWVDAGDRDLCPATDENAADQFHTPAP